MKTRRNFLKASLAATGAAVAAPALIRSAHAQEQVSWRMQALWDPGTTPYKFEERFVERVSQLTGGGFQIQLFAAGQIVPAAQMFDAVRAGAFQMMKNFDGYNAGAIPALAFTSTIPFGFPQSDQYEAWFYEKGGLDIAREAYGQAGIHYIAPSVYGEEPMHSREPIRSIGEMADKKGRFVGLASSVMGAFGVAVSPLPTSEVYSALERGIVDFADRGDLTANLEAGLGEVAKYIILPGVHQPTTATAYAANAQAWEQLPEAYKAALEVAAREVSGALRQHILVKDQSALAAFQEQGVEIIRLDEADIRDNRPKAVDAWTKAAGDNELAKRALASITGFMDELGLL